VSTGESTAPLKSERKSVPVNQLSASNTKNNLKVAETGLRNPMGGSALAFHGHVVRSIRERSETVRHYLSCFELGAFVAPLYMLALPITVSLTACTGIASTPAPGQSNPSGGASSGVGGSSAVGGASSSAPLDCSQAHPGPARVRRLNRFEYDNTVRDLLGDTTRPAQKFPTEEHSFK